MPFALVLCSFTLLFADTNALSGGFGSKPIAKRKSKLPADVEEALLFGKGDLSRSQAFHFSRSVNRLASEDPKLHGKLMQEQSRLESSGADLASLDRTVHSKLVELTWDTVAAFTVDAKLEEQVEECLEKIGLLAATGLNEDSSLRILDIGCGDATILPFLSKAGASTKLYTGVDVSKRMIEKARRKFPQANFINMNFADGGDNISSILGGPFDCIIFNGSIQFFFDTEHVIKRALTCLVPGGRILITHVHGSSFVESEKAGSPLVVASLLPSNNWLSEHAQRLGLELEVAPSEQNGDPYIAALRRTAEVVAV